MSQTNPENLSTNSNANANSNTLAANASTAAVRQGSYRSLNGAIQPAANLLELFHARHLRDNLAAQITRLEEQSCAVRWGTGMAEFEPLYCDSTIVPMRDPLNADEVCSHYVDLLVAMDHLLEQLGEFSVER